MEFIIVELNNNQKGRIVHLREKEAERFSAQIDYDVRWTSRSIWMKYSSLLWQIANALMIPWANTPKGE